MKDFFAVICRNRRALVGMILLGIFLLIAIVGPIIVPLETATNYSQRYQLPSLKHPFGTDYAGRDTFQQFVHGSRNVITVSFVTAIFTILIAFIVGTTAVSWVEELIP